MHESLPLIFDKENQPCSYQSPLLRAVESTLQHFIPSGPTQTSTIKRRRLRNYVFMRAMIDVDVYI
jgi:hypothetical protein